MSGSGPIVFVDGDQTLWDFQAVMRRALRIVLAELRRLRPGPPTAGLTVESMVEDRARTAAALRGRQTDLERLRLASFRHTLARIGIPDDELAAQLNALYRQHRFAGVELYPDVLPALRTLGADHRLGLLSNGNSYPERCGLEGVFAHVVFSQDHGVEKPDGRIFRIAADLARAAPEDLVMVGDSVPNDVVGARRAGWRSLWLNRDGAALPTALEPADMITTLADLPGRLATMRWP